MPAQLDQPLEALVVAEMANRQRFEYRVFGGNPSSHASNSSVVTTTKFIVHF
jgi:hypothetical protein